MVGGKPVDFENIEELDEDAALGVGKVEDFTWKGLLDFTTCTECGRCQRQCPAWNTEKPLSPKMLVMALRDHAHAKAPYLLATEDGAGGAAGATTKALAELPLVGSTGYDITNPLGAYNPHGPDAVIDPDVLWSCTTCGACVEQCPVDIEHVDAIVDMRRYQVLIESAFPSELGGLFKNLENKANPWGMAARARLDWAKDLPFEVKVVGQDVEDACRGGLPVLGRLRRRLRGPGEEDHPGRGRAAGHRRASASPSSVTASPAPATPPAGPATSSCSRCWPRATSRCSTRSAPPRSSSPARTASTRIKNEYPQVGGSYEVVHHTQLLNRLVREKKLVPVARPNHADRTGAASTAAIGDLPRPLLPRPAQRRLRPAARAASGPCPASTCWRWSAPARSRSAAAPAVPACGWRRSSAPGSTPTAPTEAVATGADRIAIGCPFCRVMLSDGLAAQQSDGEAREEVEVVDVAQMLLAAVRRGDDGRGDADVDTSSAPDPEPAPVA